MTAHYRTVIQLISKICEAFSETDSNYKFKTLGYVINNRGEN